MTPQKNCHTNNYRKHYKISVTTEDYLKAILRKRCRQMAKPIPDINLGVLSKNEEIKPEDDSVIDSTINRINKKKSSRDLVLGTLSGWLLGVGSYKVGKIAAFGIGGSIILLHFASELGYVHINWDRVKETLDHSEQLVENVEHFVKKNSCFSVGFIGGFFFGVASA